MKTIVFYKSLKDRNTFLQKTSNKPVFEFRYANDAQTLLQFESLEGEALLLVSIQFSSGWRTCLSPKECEIKFVGDFDCGSPDGKDYARVVQARARLGKNAVFISDDMLERVYREANGSLTKSPPLSFDRLFRAMRAMLRTDFNGMEDLCGQKSKHP